MNNIDKDIWTVEGKPVNLNYAVGFEVVYARQLDDAVVPTASRR